ncbi:hypothetical protein HK097_004788 [Rhizophlyctis rosea]|uniref:Uncharacterized protein n=1 Tax=Rhizophlyctis rosea TaxID=64517 RepID=A0AAD5WZA3_9FUNG|nr:hypothetical protein HK097_004788 [Rhizophlyctis rosea]
MKRKRSNQTPTATGEQSRNLAPTSKASADMPRKYRAVLAYQKAKDAASDKRSVGKKSVLPQRLPGETLGQFNRRIDEDLRQAVNTAAQSESKTKQKKKTWLAQRKAKSKGKKKDGEEDEDDREAALKDNIKFGTVLSLCSIISLL